MSEAEATDQQINPSAGIAAGKVLVTGATGHLGSNVVRRLLADQHDVRALVQANADNRSIEGLPIERIEGDLRDLASLRRAVQGVDRVFHIAAKISTAKATAVEQRALYEINVIGTRDLLRACLDANVGRVVMTGSFSATGFDLDDPSLASDESLPFYPFGHTMPYAHTKALAEHELLKAAAEGLDAVIATSCGCIGAWDYLPSRMGGTLCDLANGKLRAYVEGGFTWVRGVDIADGHMRAMEYGRKGQKYLFATEFLTISGLFNSFREVAGIQRELIEVPIDLVGAVAAIYSGTLARFFPTASQRLTPGSIAVLKARRHVDVSKARRELGFRPTSMREAMCDAYDFYLREGMIRRDVRVSVPAADAAE
jgi:nucleoside-diphosphate-sugar epimerase